MWISGEALSYDGWLSGQPNDAAGIENAVIYMGNLLITDDLGWSDYPWEATNTGFQAIPTSAVVEIEP